MSQPISSLMRRDVCCVNLDDTIDSVEKTLSARRLTWVPVIDSDGTAMGVISAPDLLRFHADNKDASTVRAWQLCTYKPIAVRSDALVAAVARLMVDRGVHHVVVTGDGGIVGVVSSMDFVRSFV